VRAFVARNRTLRGAQRLLPFFSTDGDIETFSSAGPCGVERPHRLRCYAPRFSSRRSSRYQRHGTLSLYAALNTQTSEVIGDTAARHTSEEFVAFLTALVDTQPQHRPIHIILDNLATHTKLRMFLAEVTRRRSQARSRSFRSTSGQPLLLQRRRPVLDHGDRLLRPLL
jgi:hypothetical protein